MSRTFTAVIQYDKESDSYVGFVPALPGTQSCADTLEGLRANLREAIELMLAVMADSGEEPAGDIEVIVEPIEIPASRSCRRSTPGGWIGC
jgi:predicted RNase H-like HicB family nuclease